MKAEKTAKKTNQNDSRTLSIPGKILLCFAYIAGYIAYIYGLFYALSAGYIANQRVLMILSIVPLSITYLIKERRVSRYTRMGLSQIDKLTGEEFEDMLCHRFKAAGYRCESTSGSNDYGADIILRKGFKKTVVQAKRYNSKVGIQAVQEVIGAKSYYNASAAAVCSNSYFTSQAKALADRAGVILIDRDALDNPYLRIG